MSETRILIRLLGMYFPQNKEFSLDLSKLWNFTTSYGYEPPVTDASKPNKQIYQKSLAAVSIVYAVTKGFNML
jgi:hypothetical protein